jgi:hypothetical protein
MGVASADTCSAVALWSFDGRPSVSKIGLRGCRPGPHRHAWHAARADLSPGTRVHVEGIAGQDVDPRQRECWRWPPCGLNNPKCAAAGLDVGAALCASHGVPVPAAPARAWCRSEDLGEQAFRSHRPSDRPPRRTGVSLMRSSFTVTAAARWRWLYRKRRDSTRGATRTRMLLVRFLLVGLSLCCVVFFHSAHR